MTRTVAQAIVAILLAALLGCQSDESPLLEVFGSPGTIATVRSAEIVTAERLARASYHRSKSSDYETLSEPVELSQDQARRLKKILLDAGSYDFEMSKGCMPEYGVRLRFRDAAGEIVDVLLCFQCHTLAVYDEEGDVGGEDFDRVSDELAGLMKELFPDDPAIQQI